MQVTSFISEGLKTLENIRKYLKQNLVGHGAYSPFQKTFLVTLVKKYEKADINFFKSCLILLDCFTYCQIFCS